MLDMLFNTSNISNMKEVRNMSNNKLGIIDAQDFAHAEERLTKKRALELYDNKILDNFEAGTFAGFTSV